ncbi:MAG TPA: AAA-like domain-containing protein [Gammaproteobacteria bacterium]|nr:AAA-like domain-containing protein [Gammaproteobacteria bacterium]
MSKAIHATEFYVVGGPVQPDRACYVERPVDAQLIAAIRARHLTCVLGARGIGKSSLMHRAARRLRQAGELVAIVDLVQIGVLAERGSGRGWGIAIAERVAREVALDADVGPWWRANKKQESERLAEFFWHVVLANTTAPVTVFFDGLGATAAELPFLRDLLEAVQICYGRRTAEPDFRRLNFVLLGSTSRRALAGNDRSSPFAAADVIELGDFSAAESYALAPGFGGEPEVAQALMDRVTVWTGGHPYLTQKVARSVIRKGGKLEDVERVVHEQLLGPGAADSDPLLHHIHGWIAAKAPGARRAAKLLRRLARGGRVTLPTDPVVAERLQLSGVVVVDAERRLKFGNRIFRELVAQWVKGAGFGLRLAVAAVVLLAIAAAAGYWYLRFLPTDDVGMLESPTASLSAIDAAYQRLHALPGFTERAEQLYSAALVRRSAAAHALADVAAIDGRLRSLPGQDAAADGLFAAFWLQREAEAAHAEQRDAALLLAQRAADLPAAPPAARGTLAELIAADYPHLERTLHLPAAPVAWRMQFAQSTLVTLDSQRQLQRSPFGEAVGGGAVGSAPVRFTALQHVALTRDLAVEGDGSAGAFELTVQVQHPATDELFATLTAPSGAEATIALPRGDGSAAQTFTFDAGHGTPLEELAESARRGVWRLALVDRRADNAGALSAWALRFGQDSWRDEPAEPQPIPDPLRTDAVTVTPEGDWALVMPQTPGAIGTVALWNLAAGRLEGDFVLPAAPKHVAINAAGNRLIAASDTLTTMWNTGDGAIVARPGTDSEFVLPPVFSMDGAYFAIAERVDEGKLLYSVLHATDGSLVGSFEGPADARAWWLGPGARYLALQMPDRSLRVVGARRGELLQTLRHAHGVARVLPLPDGATLLTIGDGGEIVAWPLGSDAAPPRRLGVTSAATSASLAAGGARLAFATDDAAVAVVDVATGAEVARLHAAGAAPAATQLTDDGTRLVTSSGAQLRLWNLPVTSGTPVRTANADALAAVTFDRGTGRLAVGLGNGGLALDALPSAAALEYLGHRGAVSAVAVNVEHGVAVTGGADGRVRVWDLASGMPTAVGVEPATAPIAAVAVTADGRLLASAAGNVVRIVSAADGSVVAERTLGGAATSLAFAGDGGLLAAGDATGTLTVMATGEAGRSFTSRAAGPISSVAFAPDGTQLAVGDAAGNVRLLRAQDGGAMGAARVLAEPVRWLDFSRDGRALLLATSDWLHAFAAEAGLPPLLSRFAPRPSSRLGSALAAGDGMQVRWVEARADGAPAVVTFDLAAPPAAPQGLAPHDWPAALGLRLDDAGQPVPYDP